MAKVRRIRDVSDRFLPEIGTFMDQLEKIYLNDQQYVELAEAARKAHERYLKDVKPKDDDRERLTEAEYWDKWCNISP